MTLAETGEVLRLLNRSGKRSGNRVSQEGAAAEADRAIELCRRAGFRRIALRGDTAFTQMVQLDRWDAAGVKVLFGMKAYPGLVNLAEDVPNDHWKPLPRSPKYDPKTPNRARPENITVQIVAKRCCDNKRLSAEWVTEVASVQPIAKKPIA
ncbi:hypothetical protein Enr13x_21690 [Stieleria neptunia]|uniref:Transposase DDE domain-containing protein n=1 Tax=Stieleria neptunia TaxID=2527979 RepID=A0A518HN90_9BACT|nr:hypothetical protein Enr13x_21690 [Stieleria neptunia]